MPHEDFVSTGRVRRIRPRPALLLSLTALGALALALIPRLGAFLPGPATPEGTTQALPETTADAPNLLEVELTPLRELAALENSAAPDPSGAAGLKPPAPGSSPLASLPAPPPGGADELTAQELADPDAALLPRVPDDAQDLRWYQATARPGDRLSALFADLGIAPQSYAAVLATPHLTGLLHTLKPGEQLAFRLDKEGTLQELVKPLNRTRQLHLKRRPGTEERYGFIIEDAGAHLKDAAPASLKAGGSPAAASAASPASPAGDKAHPSALNQMPLPPHARLVVVNFGRGESFSGAASNAGISYAEMGQILQLFKGRVQFSRALSPGDEMRVLYTAPGSTGRIEAVELRLKREPKLLGSYFEPAERRFYDERGLDSHQAAFLRTPLVKAARISSPFNPGRMHPVLGYTRPHNGTDFAVPVGTAVHAVADGIVEQAGYSQSAGYFMTVRHPGGIATIYMHLSRLIAKAGSRVRQSEVIALSGNTGLTTGPHLHYEMRIDGKPVDAMRVDLLKGVDVAVDSARRQQFEELVTRYHTELHDERLSALPSKAASDESPPVQGTPKS